MATVDLEDPIDIESPGADAAALGAAIGTLATYTMGSTTALLSDWLNATAEFVFNVRDPRYGAAGDDTTDDTAAIQAAIDDADALGRGTVYFPGGLYRVEGELTVNGDFITFRGEGARTSMIRVYHDDGYALTVEAATSPGTNFIYGFSLQNIGMRAMVETTGNALIKLNKVSGFWSSDTSLEDHFGGVDAYGGSQHYVTNMQVFAPRSSGSAAWSGVKDGSFFVRYDLSSGGHLFNEGFYTNFNARRSDSVNYTKNGIVIHAVDGLWFNNGHVMGVAEADVWINPKAGDEQITGLKFANFWSDNNSKYGFKVEGNTSAAFNTIQITGATLLTNTVAGYYVADDATNFEGFNIVGGTAPKATIGAYFGAGQKNRVSAVKFAANATAGVVISNGADDVDVLDCSFEEEAWGTTETGMVGVEIEAGSSARIQVRGCSFKLTAEDIDNASTSNLVDLWQNVSSKSLLITTTTSTSLDVPEVGRHFRVADGVNFADLSGKQAGRIVTLIFVGASTVTHNGSVLFLTTRANDTFLADDTLTLVYDGDAARWREIERTTRVRRLGSAQSATIASGAISATGALIAVDTESAAATDDLDTINFNGSSTAPTGMVIELTSTSSSRDVTVTESGNIRLSGTTRVLDTVSDKLRLIGYGGLWNETSFADVA